MPPFFSAFLAGDCTIKQSLTSTIVALVAWLIFSFLIIETIGSSLGIMAYVILINGLLFTFGALAVYGASITSHVISSSYFGSFQKLILRFFNFILLFAGIVMIILVTSGEIGWMTYLYHGVTSGVR